MAEDKNTTGVMDAPAQSGGVNSVGPDTGGSKTPQGLAEPALHFLYLGNNPGGVRIDKLLVDGKEQNEKTLKVFPGTMLEIQGAGLGFFESALLALEGSRGITFRPKNTVIDRSKGNFIKFEIPDLSNAVGESGILAAQLFSKTKPAASGILHTFLNYHNQTKEQEEKEREAKAKEGTGGGEGGAGSGVFGKNAISGLVNIGGEALEKSLGAMVGIGGSDKQQQAQPVQKSATAVSGSAAAKTEELGGDGDEAETRVAAVEQYLSAKQSLETVGEYLDKNPELIADNSTRNNVLQALASGNLNSLSAEERVALRRAVSSGIVGNQAGSIALQAAMEHVNNAVSEISAQVYGQAEVSAAGEASGSATVTGRRQAEVTVEGQQAARGTGPSGAAATVQAGGVVNQPVNRPAGGDLSMQQSMEIAGEEISKNPGLITDIKVRENVLEALSSKDLSKLTPQGRSALQNIRMPAGRPDSGRVNTALQNVNNAAAPSEQLSKEADVAQAGSGPAEAELGLKLAKQAGAEVPQETAETGGKPGSQQIPAQAGQQQPQEQEESQAEKESPLPVSKQPEVPGQAQNIQIKDKVSSTAKVSVEQNIDGVQVPAQYQAMINALGKKGRDAELAGEVAAAGQTAAKEQKAGEPLPQQIGDKTSRPAGMPGKSARSPESEPGISEGRESAEHLPAGAGQLPDKENMPEIAPPLNPEDINQPSQNNRKSRNAGGHEENPEQESSEDVSQNQNSLQSEPEEPSIKQKNSREGVSSFNLAEAEKIANKTVNAYLQTLASVIWTSSLPTFGISILAGAIVGDFSWLAKDWLVKQALKITPLPSKLGKFDQQNFKIKFNLAIKAQIAAWNAIVLALAGLTFGFVVAVIWGVCNSWITYQVASLSGMSEVCQAVKQSSIGSTLSSWRSSGSYSGSYNVPGGLIGTSQWTSQINKYAQKYNIDACIMRTVVQKESSGNSNAVNCGCAANGHPEYCPSKGKTYDASYQFNWNQCFYAIGLTQWTIYAQGGSGYRAWKDSSMPSRKVSNSWYGVNDLLDPSTSLDLTASDFSSKLAANLKKQSQKLKSSDDDYRNALRWSFAQYNGGGNPNASALAYADASMALYDICKNNNP